MDMYRILESFDAVNSKQTLVEGAVKRELHAMADKMTKAEFVAKVKADDLGMSPADAAEFWNNCNGKDEELNEGLSPKIKKLINAYRKLYPTIAYDKNGEETMEPEEAHDETCDRLGVDPSDMDEYFELEDEELDEGDMEEGNKFAHNVLKAKAAGMKKADLDGDGEMETVREDDDEMNEATKSKDKEKKSPFPGSPEYEKKHGKFRHDDDSAFHKTKVSTGTVYSRKHKEEPEADDEDDKKPKKSGRPTGTKKKIGAKGPSVHSKLLKGKGGLKEHDDEMNIHNDQDSGEYDDEAGMARQDLHTVVDAAKELHDILASDENLPEWVQAKITKALDYIDTSRDYIKSSHADQDEQRPVAEASPPGEFKPGDRVLYMNKFATIIAQDGDAYGIRIDGKPGTMMVPVSQIKKPSYDEGVAEADYSAKSARAGKDIGKPGKNFAKIAKGAAERYGSKAAGERVAGAVLNKLRHPTKEGQIDELSPKTLGSYAKKAFTSYANTARRTDDIPDDAEGKKAYHKAAVTLKNRDAGVNKAIDRMSKEGVEEGAGDLRSSVLSVIQHIYDGASAGEEMIDDVASELGQYFSQVKKSTDKTLRKAYQLMSREGAEAEGDPEYMAQMAKQAIDLLSQPAVDEGVSDDQLDQQKMSQMKRAAAARANSRRVQQQPPSGGPRRSDIPAGIRKARGDAPLGRDEMDETSMGGTVAGGIAPAPGSKTFAEASSGSHEVTWKAAGKAVHAIMKQRGYAGSKTEQGYMWTKQTPRGTAFLDIGFDERDPESASWGEGELKGAKDKSYWQSGNDNVKDLAQVIGELYANVKNSQPAMDEADEDGKKDRPSVGKKKPDDDGDGVPDWADKKPGSDDNEDSDDDKSDDDSDDDKELKLMKSRAGIEDKDDDSEDDDKESDDSDDTPKKGKKPDFGKSDDKESDDEDDSDDEKESDDDEESDDKKESKDESADKPTKSGGMKVGTGVYESAFNKSLKLQLTEGMSVNVSTDDSGKKNISVTASDEDAESLGNLLKMAGLFSSEGYSSVCQNCGGIHEADACGADHVEEDLANSPDEMYTDADYMTQTLSGGLNGPKKDQTTNPIVKLDRVSGQIEEAAKTRLWNMYKQYDKK